jgi:hypothetical protein
MRPPINTSSSPEIPVETRGKVDIGMVKKPLSFFGAALKAGVTTPTGATPTRQIQRPFKASGIQA